MSKPRINRSLLSTIGLVVALVGVVVLAFVLAPSGSEFGGADAQATERITEANPDYEPWFGNIFSPEGEIESGLFALQAAIGAGVVGYVVGVLRTRRKYERRASAPESVEIDDEVSGGSDAVR